MCGIVGFYPKKNKKANLHKLLLLGIMNETRGEDSCGIAMGDKRMIGIKNQSIARNFIAENLDELNVNNKKNQPIIFHTRKSTIGAHTEDNAHPFIYEKYNSKDPNDYFAIAHNGIIRNTIELKKNYLKELSNSDDLLKIDTHYIALSLAFSFAGHHSEEEVLTNYEGNAALIYYNKNTFKVWKGAAGNTEERPMNYIETPEGWYFCSIDTSLKIVFNNLYEVKSVENNQLLTFHNHELQSSVIIERKLPTPVVVHSTVKTYSEYERGRNVTYDDYDLDIYGNYKKKDSREVKPYYEQNIIHCVPKFSIVQNCYVDSSDSQKMVGLHYSVSDVENRNLRLYSLQKLKGYFKHAVLFEMGILVKSYRDWTILKNRFNKTIYATIDGYFKGELDTIKKVILDFLPLYDDKKNLVMMIYKTKTGAIDYISKYDMNSIEVPLIFGNQNLLLTADGKELDVDTVRINSFKGVI
jgi:predicted glutamine amidotransferase